MAVCCQNLMLGALSSRSALSALVGALFKKFGLFLNTLRMCHHFLYSAHFRQDYHSSKFGIFWVIGTERNICRCTFNRYSVI